MKSMRSNELARWLGWSTTALLLLAPPVVAQPGIGAGGGWLECTGEAAPPAEARPRLGRIPMSVDGSFRRGDVANAFEAEWGDAPASGCALFLMRWTNEGTLDPGRVLETDLPDSVVSRIREILIESRVLRAPFPAYMRVLVRPEAPMDLAVGFAWEEPPTLANRDEVDDLLGAIQLGNVPRAEPELRVFVTEDGVAEEVELVRFSGSSFVDQQLLWISDFFQFTPATVEGTPVPGWALFPFVLTDTVDPARP